MAKPKLLKNMRLDEISLVDEPASPGARVMIFKRRPSNEIAETANPADHFPVVRKHLEDSGVPAEFISAFDDAVQKALPKVKAQTFEQVQANDEAQREAFEASQEITEFLYALGEAIRSIYADPSVKDKPAKIAESIEQFVAAVKEHATSGDDDKETEMEKAKTPCADCADPEACKAKGACIMADNKDETVNKADIQKMIDDAVAKAKAESAEAIKKANEAADEAIKKADAKIAEIEKQRANEVRLAKAKTMVEGVPGANAEDVAKMLAGLDEAGVAALEKTFAATREVAKLGNVTKALGSDAGNGGDTTPADAIEKAAAEILKAHPTLTKEQAVDKALAANPALYADFKKSRAA